SAEVRIAVHVSQADVRIDAPETCDHAERDGAIAAEHQRALAILNLAGDCISNLARDRHDPGQVARGRVSSVDGKNRAGQVPGVGDAAPGGPESAGKTRGSERGRCPVLASVMCPSAGRYSDQCPVLPGLTAAHAALPSGFRAWRKPPRAGNVRH